MKLSNVNQPTASTRIVHHVYSTCPNVGIFLVFSLLCFYNVLPDTYASELITHICDNLHPWVFSMHVCNHMCV